MYEESVASERAASCRGLKRGMILDFNDPKKLHSKTDPYISREFLTNRDLGMLELTSPELERIILDPIDARFPGARTSVFGNQSFGQRPQEQGPTATQQQNFDRSFNSQLEDQQLRHPHNLPEPALAAAASFDDDSDSEPSPYTYTTLVPPRSSNAASETGFNAASETGFPYESFSNVNSKSASVQNSVAVSVGDGGCTSRVNTLLPTAVHPGVSYLPIAAFQSVQPRLKEEPMQRVPCLDGNATPSFPPMSPVNMDHQDLIRQERKRERNRLAARKCRTKKLEQIMHLEERVKELKEQNRALGEAATALRAQMNKLQSHIAQHVSCGCPLMMMTTTAMMMKHDS